MSTTAPRTINHIDHDLARHTWILQQATQRMAATAAELAWIRIDQLLDERLAAATTPRP